MSWKTKLHPKVSRAEISIFKELSRQGLTTQMVTQKPIILRQTIPDFWWLNRKKVVYIDGAHVHSGAQAELDLEISELLELKGFSVRRIRYNPPLTRDHLKKIVEEIREFIGESGDE